MQRQIGPPGLNLSLGRMQCRQWRCRHAMAECNQRVETLQAFASLLTTRGAIALRGRVHWSEMMTSARPRATVWVDARPSSMKPSDAVRHRPDAERVLWAERPFPARGGLCVAVSLRNGELVVALRAAGAPGKLEWLPAARVLSDSEANSWAKTGFREALDAKHVGGQP